MVDAAAVIPAFHPTQDRRPDQWRRDPEVTCSGALV